MRKANFAGSLPRRRRRARPCRRRGDRGRARRARREDGLRAGHDRDGHGARDGARRRLDRRVEILSDVQKELNVEAQDVAALSRTQTVGEVVEAMIKELGGAGAAPVAAAAPSAPAAAAAPSSGVPRGDGGRPRRARRQAGYDPDMIEMDMALETELGVGSISVLRSSDVQKELNVEAQGRRGALADRRRGRRGDDQGARLGARRLGERLLGDADAVDAAVDEVAEPAVPSMALRTRTSTRHIPLRRPAPPLAPRARAAPPVPAPALTTPPLAPAPPPSRPPPS